MDLSIASAHGVIVPGTTVRDPTALTACGDAAFADWMLAIFLFAAGEVYQATARFGQR
jgi:hypothetical protein